LGLNRHTSAILDWASVSEQIAEKYSDFAAGPDAELTAESKNKTPRMEIARIPDNERSRMCDTRNDEGEQVPSNDTSGLSGVSIATAMTFCQKQRLLWRVRTRDIDLSDKGAVEPVFEAFDIAGHTFRTDESRSGVAIGSQITTFFRDFEAFRRIIMNIHVDRL
jgi:hypothetical protein